MSSKRCKSAAKNYSKKAAAAKEAQARMLRACSVHKSKPKSRKGRGRGGKSKGHHRSSRSRSYGYPTGAPTAYGRRYYNVNSPIYRSYGGRVLPAYDTPYWGY